MVHRLVGRARYGLIWLIRTCIVPIANDDPVCLAKIIDLADPQCIALGNLGLKSPDIEEVSPCQPSASGAESRFAGCLSGKSRIGPRHAYCIQ